MPPRLLPVLTLMIFVVMADGRVMTATLPDIAADLGTTVAFAGIALTVYLLAYGTFQLAYGPLSDRVGAIRVMSVAAIVLAAVLAVTAFVPNLGALIGLRFLAGAVAAAFFPLALATVGTLVPYADRQPVIATLLAAVALGQILGAAIGGIVADLLSWRAMFVIDAALAAVLIVPLWLRRGAVAGTAPTGSPFAGHRRLLRDRRAWMVYGFVMLEGAAIIGGTGYLGALLHNEYGLSLVIVGLILTLDGAAIFVTSRLMKRIAARASENALIAVGAAFMAAGFLLILLVGRWQAVIPAVIALGVGFALCHTTLQTRATSLDPRAPGTAISLFAFSLFVGSASARLLSGSCSTRPATGPSCSPAASPCWSSGWPRHGSPPAHPCRSRSVGPWTRSPRCVAWRFCSSARTPAATASARSEGQPQLWRTPDPRRFDAGSLQGPSPTSPTWDPRPRRWPSRPPRVGSRRTSPSSRHGPRPKTAWMTTAAHC